MILLNILLQIIIGIKNINKFAKEKTNAAKRSSPLVVFWNKKDRHNATEKPCHNVNVRLILFFAGT